MRSTKGEWLDYRKSEHHNGIQSLPRKSGVLEARWSIDVGGSYQEIEPIPDGSGDLLLAAGGGIQRISRTGEYRWRSKPFGAHWITGVFDLDDDGRLEIVTSNGRELIILSATNGAILYRKDVGPPYSYGTYETMFQVHKFFDRGMQIVIPCFSNKEVLMFDCSRGAERTEILHRLWMDDGYHPSIVIGDVNRDGVDEIVIARLGGVYVFEPHSGSMLSQTLWKSDAERRRNYGHFELADIDNDGDLEAIIVSDKVTRHIAVLDNDGRGQFQPLWDRFIEHIYPEDTTELRATSNSLSDVNGDGKLELTISLYNDRKDHRWHTEVLDPITGQLLNEFPDRYLRGIQELTSKDSCNICVSEEHDRIPAYLSPLSIYSTDSNEPCWTLDAGRFAERTIHTAPHVSEFKPDLFSPHEIWSRRAADSEGLLLITARDNRYGLSLVNSQLQTIEISSESPDRILICHIDDDGIVISRPDGKIENLKIADRPSHATPMLSCGYHLTPEAHISARPGIESTVFEDDGVRYLVTPHFSNVITIHTYVEQNLVEVARIPGRGLLGYDNVSHTVSAITVAGRKLLPIVDDEYMPHARLSLYTAEGVRNKSFEWREMPSSNPANRLGCYNWLAFRHSRGEALLVSFYQSASMNSECSIAALIETGEELWRLERTGEGEFGRGMGPWSTASIDNSHGRQIALFCAKDTLCEIDLETGTFVKSPRLLTAYTSDKMRQQGLYREQSLGTFSSIDDPFTAYGSPVLFENETVVAGSFGGFGVLNPDRSAKWWQIASFGDVLYRLPGIGDIDGAGKLEFGQSHAEGVFRIYDFATGALLHTLSLDCIGTDILTCDVNGDGKMEFVTGTSDGRLVIIGHDGHEFTILEEKYIGSGVGSPIAADLDGDGSSEIFIASADGKVTCFG